MYMAVTKNHGDILEWAFMNGCPCDPKIIWKEAPEFSIIKTLIWAKKHFLAEFSGALTSLSKKSSSTWPHGSKITEFRFRKISKIEPKTPNKSIARYGSFNKSYSRSLSEFGGRSRRSSIMEL
jgi:hypothetical protein